MFGNDQIDKYSFEEIPTDRDCFLMSDIYMEEYAQSLEKMLAGEECNPYEIGFVSPVAIRKINAVSAELSWYPNTYTRFHEVSIALPKDAFRACVGCWQYDIKPYIFVSHDWLEQLHLRDYSVYALVDAIGVKQAIASNNLTKAKLITLRDRIDELAAQYPDISFISFADSLILKSNYEMGYFDKGVKCSYRPENILYVIKAIDEIYRDVLNLSIYAVLTQGSNEYYGESLLHISKTGNHVCLNSLGVPFAELLAIESTAKKAIRAGDHPPMQLYLDEQFYLSINFVYDFEKTKKPKHAYVAIMKSHQPNYFYSDCDSLIAGLDLNRIDR
jgi:hypothetical protein